jgi:hypothetical protein
MKTAISLQPSAFSASLVRQGLGCALRTALFFNNRQERRSPLFMASRKRPS